MDEETMLKYWELMDIERLDEDHRTLLEMERTAEVEWLISIAVEAKRRHHEWLREHHPELIAAALKQP